MCATTATVSLVENHDVYKQAMHAEAEIVRARLREIEMALEFIDPTERSIGTGWGSSDPQGYILEQLNHAYDAAGHVGSAVSRLIEIVAQDPRYQS